MLTILEPPASLELYTRAIDDLVRALTKSKDSRHILHIRGGSPVSVHDYGIDELNRWENALAKLQKRSMLLVAVVDGPLCDLSLSLALACDVRLGSVGASLPKPPASEHVPLPLWWLASLALHVGATRAQQLLWRQRDVRGAELLELRLLNHAPLGGSARELCDAAMQLPVPGCVPMDLLRRIVLQGFSIAGADQIGHSLAISSLVIAEAVGRATAASMPLPDLRPLAFKLTQAADAWTLELTAAVRAATRRDATPRDATPNRFPLPRPPTLAPTLACVRARWSVCPSTSSTGACASLTRPSARPQPRGARRLAAWCCGSSRAPRRRTARCLRCPSS